ncbi:MAG TPA: RNA 2',3'-cyclic phosphodiesterase [Egibacteraceae bacterium]|nr:RNA 2',3'-cyclic phosphodiesterase [Egibacteraceae bacterium]
MDADAKTRLFVAVEVPARVRSAVDAATGPLRAEAGQARWTDPAGWHLTLAFLGWVEAQRVADVEAAVASAVRGAEPFEVALSGAAGTFGGGVLWAGMDDSAALAALADGLRAALTEAGFAQEERPFHAHLTLARAPRGARIPRGLAERYVGPTSSWRVDEVVLMRSRLRRGGARYTPVAAWPLGAPRS